MTFSWANQGHRISFFYFVMYLGFGAFQPLFPLYLQKAMGFSITESSLIISMIPFVSFIGTLIWGFVSDRWRQPCTLLSITSFCTALVVSLFLLPISSLPIGMMIAILLGLFQSSLVTLIDSITLQFAKQKDTENPRKLRSWATWGLGLGSLIFGFLAGHWIPIVIIWYALILCVSSWISLQLPNEGKTQKKSIRSGIKRLFSKPWLPFWGAVVCIIGPIQSFNALVGSLLPSVEESAMIPLITSSAMIGIISVVVQISQFLFMQKGEIWFSRWKISTLLMIVAVSCAMRWLLIFIYPSWITFSLAAMIQGGGVGILFSYLLEKLGTRSSNIGMYYMVIALANSGWTVATGFMAEVFGTFSGTLVLGIITLFPGLVCLHKAIQLKSAQTGS